MCNLERVTCCAQSDLHYGRIIALTRNVNWPDRICNGKVLLQDF